MKNILISNELIELWKNTCDYIRKKNATNKKTIYTRFGTKIKNK